MDDSDEDEYEDEDGCRFGRLRTECGDEDAAAPCSSSFDDIATSSILKIMMYQVRAIRFFCLFLFLFLFYEMAVLENQSPGVTVRRLDVCFVFMC